MQEANKLQQAKVENRNLVKQQQQQKLRIHEQGINHLRFTGPDRTRKIRQFYTTTNHFG
jgi:hypothetical protein